MIAKRMLASMLAVGLMLVSVPVQAQGEDICSKCGGRVDMISSTCNSTGRGYQHSYTGHDGITRGCGVTIMEYTKTYQCQSCYCTWTEKGVCEKHETNHT